MPLLFGVLSLVLIAFALTFALSSPPPSTPPLAEVAPAPHEQLDVERVEQSSRFGEGQGGEGECVAGDPGCAGAAEETRPDQATQQQPDVIETSAPGAFRGCSHGGTTQTQDPQSPPCKADVFQGDNGGTTSTGVTATEIRVGVPLQETNCVRCISDVLPGLVGHFQKYYELYGRSLTLVEVDVPDGEPSDPSIQRAAAQNAIDADVFATLQYDGFGPFQQRLADAGVLSFVGGLDQGILPEQRLREMHPYVWSVYVSHEEAHRAAAEVVCGGLAGRPAQHGGDDVRERTRRFGVLQQPRQSTVPFLADAITPRLTACGADFRVYDQPQDPDDLGVILQRMQSDGITTIVCLCRELTKDELKAAEALGFRPEWFLAGARETDLRLADLRTQSPSDAVREQLAHVFGLSIYPRRPSQDYTGGDPRYGEQFWFHAAREGDPEFTATDQNYDYFYSYYAQLLTLVSGIQWAGPELTPRNWADALVALRFANPGVGQAPWYQPRVALSTTDHGFNSDLALAWWRDPDDAGYESRTDLGDWCFVADGARYTASSIPAGVDDLLFDPEEGCR